MGSASRPPRTARLIATVEFFRDKRSVTIHDGPVSPQVTFNVELSEPVIVVDETATEFWVRRGGEVTEHSRTETPPRPKVTEYSIDITGAGRLDLPR